MRKTCQLTVVFVDLLRQKEIAGKTAGEKSYYFLTDILKIFKWSLTSLQYVSKMSLNRLYYIYYKTQRHLQNLYPVSYKTLTTHDTSFS